MLRGSTSVHWSAGIARLPNGPTTDRSASRARATAFSVVENVPFRTGMTILVCAGHEERVGPDEQVVRPYRADERGEHQNGRDRSLAHHTFTSNPGVETNRQSAIATHSLTRRRVLVFGPSTAQPSGVCAPRRPGSGG